MSVQIGNIDLGEFPLLLAPMEDVSDPPFRYVCKQNGADMMYTEFISSEGLIRDAAKSRQKLDIFEYERPIGIQIFGSDIDHMREATEIASLAGPDLIDIVNATNLPVTVKTRLGWDDNTKNVYKVAERLQDVGIKALTIHGRTRSQMYKGVADWTLIREIKKNPIIQIPIFGNGDIDSPQKAAMWRMEYGVDGMMIGRAAIGYPWIFREIKHYFKTGEQMDKPTIAERIAACTIHLKKSIEWKGPKTGIFEMRRHYSNYFKGIENFKEYRMRLVTASGLEEVLEILFEVEQNPRFASFEREIEF